MSGDRDRRACPEKCEHTGYCDYDCHFGFHELVEERDHLRAALEAIVELDTPVDECPRHELFLAAIGIAREALEPEPEERA